MVTTQFEPLTGTGLDKNIFELVALSHAHSLQSILCEKGKDLADITEDLRAQCHACEHKKICVRKLN